MNYLYTIILIVVALPFVFAYMRMNEPNAKKTALPKQIKSSDDIQLHVERFDDGHEIEYKVVNDINRELSIVYLDSEGNKTTRDVTALQLHKYGNAWFLYAFCQVKQANRHFRIVRLKKIVDKETDEIIEKRFVEYLRSI